MFRIKIFNCAVITIPSRVDKWITMKIWHPTCEWDGRSPYKIPWGFVFRALIWNISALPNGFMRLFMTFFYQNLTSLNSRDEFQLNSQQKKHLGNDDGLWRNHLKHKTSAYQIVRVGKVYVILLKHKGVRSAEGDLLIPAYENSHTFVVFTFRLQRYLSSLMLYSHFKSVL